MPRAAVKARRKPLSRETIERRALALIERDGLAAFSMRRLADALGCEAMSIYHHFPSKAHLMDALLDRVVASVPLAPETLPWRDRLRQNAFAMRQTALRYPEFFQFAALHRMNTATGLRLLEQAMAVFRDAGFDSEQTARLFRAYSYYVIGAALDETAGYARGPSAVEPVPAETVRRDYPLVTAANPYFQRAHHEATFGLGLEMLLEGIERRAPSLARRRSG
jgi:AcrR family transcriptional regulator